MEKGGTPGSQLKLARSQSRLSFDPSIADADVDKQTSPHLQLQRTHSRLSFLSRSSNRENSNQSTTLDGDADDETASNGPQAKRPAQEKWVGGRNWKPPVHAKTDEQLLHLSEVISCSLLFEALPKKELNQVKQAMRGPHRVLSGMEVIRQDMLVDSGEAALYIVESGKLACFIRSDDMPHPGALARVYDRKGQFFGEMALVFKCPRFASIVAQTESILWSLDRDSFNHLVRDGFLSLRSRARTCLERCLAFANVDQESRKTLLGSMELRKFEPGALMTVLRSERNDSESASQELFIIESGRAVASGGKHVGEQVKNAPSEKFFDPSQFFGLHVGLPPFISECSVQAHVPTVCAVVNVRAIELQLARDRLAGAIQEPWTAFLTGRMPLPHGVISSPEVDAFRLDASPPLSRSRSAENFMPSPCLFSFLWPRRVCEHCGCSLSCGVCRLCSSKYDDDSAEAHIEAKIVLD